jgi:hypothetical protein
LAQLGDIHTGKFSNWKQVGGKDQPITIYTSTPTGSTSAMVKKAVMKGAEYAAGVKTMASFSRIADMVHGDEAGIGALSRGFVRADGRVKVIETTKIMRPLALVTVGEPSAQARQVIDALKAAAGPGARSRWRGEGRDDPLGSPRISLRRARGDAAVQVRERTGRCDRTAGVRVQGQDDGRLVNEDDGLERATLKAPESG